MEAKVCEEEIIGLRLYTGPLFCKLNAVLRNKGKTEGNNYSNVIHAILSGIAKLSQVSGIPAGRRVYRGVGGMRLPACFYVRNDKGVLGGAERAFMSTTTNRDVAIYVRVRACALRCCVSLLAVCSMPNTRVVHALVLCVQECLLDACVCALCDEMLWLVHSRVYFVVGSLGEGVGEAEIVFYS